jgi:hypothetical protein
MWLDAQHKKANISPGLLEEWSTALGYEASMNHFIAYLAGIAGTAAYQRKFRNDLQTPGVRVPISSVPDLVGQVVKLGEAVLWLHTFGLRGTAPDGTFPGLVSELPRLVSAPKRSASSMPAGFSFEAASGRILFGEGLIEGVSPEVAHYTTSGMSVLRKWFAYRRPDPAGRSSGPLSKINAESWLAEWTSDLLEILTTLTWLVALEPQAEALISLISSGRSVTFP